jgi:hypothetical protein
MSGIRCGTASFHETTRRAGFSLSRAASTQPADPAPTMSTSNS